MSRPTLNLDEMTRDEKVRLIEVPEWPRRELDRRLDELDRGEVTGIPWEQVLQEIQSHFGCGG